MAHSNSMPPPPPEAWEKWKPEFIRLYVDQNEPLPVVMQKLEAQGFTARYDFSGADLTVNTNTATSPKMYKNRIKAWGITKYLKKEQAEQLAKSDSTDKDRAQRSLSRRKARENMREKQQREKSTPSDEEDARPGSNSAATFNVKPPIALTQTSHITTNNYVAEPSPIQTEPARPWTPPASLPRRPTLDGTMPVLDHLLVNFRRWTHEAVISGHWERAASTQHEKARHVSRLLASDLQAGMKYMEQDKPQMAWIHWRSANRRFQDKDLFNTWYHETPIRLLFEIARIRVSGHSDFAASLLRSTGDWAAARLKPDDVRHALYSTYGMIDVVNIRMVYEAAARCMLDGLSSRLEKNDPLLFEVRLNRALDMTWFDETADLSEWLPSLETVDEIMGQQNNFCIYYLLLQAYQLVARNDNSGADKKVAEARRRIDALPPGSIDSYKLGMAYRRLGRMQYRREHWDDARRSFNQAGRNLKTGKQADGLMIEVLQCQLNLARATDDVVDVEIFQKMLLEHEQKIRVQEQQEMQEELAKMDDGSGFNGYSGTTPEIMVNGVVEGPIMKIQSPGPGKLSRVSTL